jgi:hypothetical protein
MKKGFLPPMTFLLLLSIGGVYLFLLTSLPADSFWSNDDGTKFLIAHNLSLRNDFDMYIAYPARDIDPDLKYHPFPPPLGFVMKGKIYGIFSNAFPLFSAFFYKRLSFGGLYILPLFFGLATFALLTLFFEKEADKMKILLMAAFSTPLFFYSLNFWDHTPAVFFALLAFYWGWRGCTPEGTPNVPTKSSWYLAGAGLTMALGQIFRDEAYGLGLGLFLAVLWWARPKKGILYYLGGQLGGLLPFWLINIYAFGHPLGPHFSFSRHVSHYNYSDFWLVVTRSAGVFWTYLFGMQPALWCGVTLAAATFLALTLSRLYRRGKISSPLLLAGFCLYGLAALTALVITIRLPDPILNSQFVNTLFSGTPYLLFVFLGINLSESREKKKFWAFAGVIIVVHIIFASLIPMAGGLQWGMRYLLVLYPLLLLLAYSGARAWQEQFKNKTRIFMTGFFIFLLLLAFLSQGYGYTLLKLKKEEGRYLWRQVAAESREVLVTDLPWASQEGAAIFYQKKMLYVLSPRELGKLTASLKAKGLKSFSFLTHRENTWAASAAASALGLEAESSYHLRRPRLDFMDLLLVNYRIL